MHHRNALRALALALSLGCAASGVARAGGLWFDFDHDASFLTIQPYTSRGTDSLSVVLDLSGLSVTAPFAVTVRSQQNFACFPNGGQCELTSIQLMSETRANADSATLTQVSSDCGNPLVQELRLHFQSMPPAGIFTAVKLLLSYPIEPDVPCTNPNVVVFYDATVVSGPTLMQPGSAKVVKVQDQDVGIAGTTWSRIRQIYR